MMSPSESILFSTWNECTNYDRTPVGPTVVGPACDGGDVDGDFFICLRERVCTSASRARVVWSNRLSIGLNTVK